MSWKRIKYFDVDFYTPVSYGNRTHELCRLPNGIITLLISDPTESAIGCSLTVAAGSYHDPEEIPGLAHLCEHMLLAGGSKKYPSLGLYHDVIAKNNGSHNAFTTGDQTSFYFELPDFHQSSDTNFEKVADIFASFFVEPLFDRASINKEVYAIQNEHDSNVSNTTKILYHATRLLSDQNHPFSRFMTGNMSTLRRNAQSKGLSLRGSLLRFFRKNYAGCRMTLCIRGPQSVHGLAKLALSTFSDIPAFSPEEKGPPTNNSHNLHLGQDENPLCINVLRDAWATNLPTACCFPDGPVCNAIFVNSTKHPIARFLFPVLQRNTIFTSKDFAIYAQFWVELFGDESPGSLSYYLSQHGWITCCYAYSSDFSFDNSALILELSLTNSGWQNIELIGQVILFSMIPAFSKKNTVELARFLSEQFSIDIIKFLSSTADGSPMEECSQLSSLLQKDLRTSDISYIFKGLPMLMDCTANVGLFGESRSSKEWWIGQAIKFQSYLKSFMSSSKMRMILHGPLRDCPMFDSAVQGKNTAFDQFYAFEYFKCNLDIKKPPQHLTPSSLFHIPLANDYIPTFHRTFLSLRAKLEESSQRSKEASLAFSVRRTDLLAVPRLVSRNEKHDMWVLDEASNFSSQTLVTFELTNLQIKASPENTINLEVLAQIISLTLSSDLYPAVKLGFSLQIFPSMQGDVRLKFTVGGYSERILQLIKASIDAIQRTAKDSSFPSRELFRSARVLVRKKYENAANENSIKLASVGLLIIMERYMWTLEDLIEAIENTDINAFKEFCAMFANSSTHLTLFIQGDLSCADDINGYLDHKITHHLRASLTETPRRQKTSSTKRLDPGTNVYFRYMGRKDDPTNSIVYFIQTGLRNDQQSLTYSALCEYIMSFSLVPQLRNRRQLGYVVLGGLRLLCDTIGLHITVMSSSPSTILEDHVNQYLLYLEDDVLNTLTEQRFRTDIIESFLGLLEKDGLDKLEKYAGPADLLDELAANIQHGDTSVLQSHSMKRHKKLANQILAGQHNFADYGLVDLAMLRRLTLHQFKAFFAETVSIRSKTRAKISILVGSPLSDEQITSRAIFLQLQCLFKLHGLVIESDRLRDIVDRSAGKPTRLTKELYQYFHARRETWRLCTLILREVLRMLAVNLRSRRDREAAMTTIDQGHAPAVQLTYMEDVNVYRREFVESHPSLSK
ncbi:hypothetical protein HG536_0C02420 [Torulaspora globosa]|uniref:Peptidase M16 N-terminal domain-containing protein n=1 Tax=Torulaspora globosa TaxID=48254 RepID=A0A7G3ZEY7_9SACH|nr:uncharacterized protein HG536_0C02420 [Torulaspora globosa]QLL32073.1 hypothetical protein HG536_0C02420 [Torulaspora globosa]